MLDFPERCSGCFRVSEAQSLRWLGLEDDFSLQHKLWWQIFLEARLQVVRKLFAARAAKAGVALPVVHAASTPVEKVVDELTNHLGADDVIVAVGSKKATRDWSGGAPRSTFSAD